MWRPFERRRHGAGAGAGVVGGLHRLEHRDASPLAGLAPSARPRVTRSLGLAEDGHVLGEVHLALQEALDRLASGGVGAREALVVGVARAGDRDVEGDGANLVDGGEDRALGELVVGGHLGERDGGVVEHRIRDRLREADTRAQADAGEDVHVVALRRVKRLAADRDGVERAARGDDGAAVSPRVRLLRRDLRRGGRVGERHHDRLVVRGRHRSDGGLRDGALAAAQAEDQLGSYLLAARLE
mmetsp:Transcript_60808/g.166624  ORF Transcript_60808/g.166624 Transcript_60808/m.166624 type:complete len:242 (-) Transcript_60808:1385-2110(-)